MHIKYKKTLMDGGGGGRVGRFTNAIRWVSPHRDGADTGSEATRANRTQPSRETMAYNESTGRPAGSTDHRLLHSIPKVRSEKQLRCLSYSIPLVCVLALLGLFGKAISLSHIGAYADETQAVDDYTLAPSVKLSITSCLDGNCSDAGEDSTVSGTSLATVGETVYSRVYGVSVDAVDVEKYALTMNSNSENGELVGTQGDIVATAGGKQASEIDKDTWGYILLDGSPEGVTQASLASAQVEAMPGAEGSTEIASGKSNGVNTAKEELTSTKSIAFAAKFGDEAATGHYTTAVTLSLTASPKTVGAKGFGGVYYMQDLTADICKSVDPDTPGELEDKRDGTIYTVARIKNATTAGSNKDTTANCWMTSNLAFDIKGKSDQMTVALSDVVESKTTWAAGATVQEGAFTNDTVSATGDGSAQYSKNGAGSEDYKPEYGYYYSWCAATAGSCTDSITDDGSSGKRSASQSICPKGWKLPTGGSGGEYQALLGSSSWSTVNAGTKYNFYPAGGIYNIGAGGTGSDARYWSSTSISGTHVYIFAYNGTMNPAYNGSRDTGLSVRCVVETDPSMADVTYMQDVTTDICKNSVLKQQYTLIDKRDKKPYTVAKLDDNNCWMTQNLQLAGGTKLTTVDSDLNVGSFVKSATDTSVSTTSTDTFTLPSSISGTGTFNNDNTKIEMNNGNATDGAYYTWCAATAGCKKADGKNPGAEENAGSSICPKGWKLPLSGSANSTISKTAANGSFARMLGAGEFTSGNSTSMSKLTSPPYNFKNTSGQYYNGSLSGTTNGYYWSRTADSTAYAYHLYLSSRSFDMYPAYFNSRVSRYLGNSVRCVLEVSEQE